MITEYTSTIALSIVRNARLKPGTTGQRSQPARDYLDVDPMLLLEVRHLAEDLRTALVAEGSEGHRGARPVTRLMVLPFRLLRPDAEIDFLAFSLADAVTNSLSPLESLVVRSTLAPLVSRRMRRICERSPTRPRWTSC